MAKITIREVDNTSSTSYDEIDLAVFIPGMSINALPEETGYDKEHDVPLGKVILCKTVSEFEEQFGTTPVHEEEVISEEHFVKFFDRSYVEAHYLLEQGMSVYYCVPTYRTPDEYDDAGVLIKKGKVRGPMTEDELIEAMKDTYQDPEEDYISFKEVLNSLKDRSKFRDLAFITTGGYDNIDNGLFSNILAVCDPTGGDDPGVTGRGDCIAFADHAADKIKLSDIKSVFYNAKGPKSEFDSTYAAAFTPWVKLSVKVNNITPNEEFLAFPPSVGYLLAFAKSVQNNNEWLAVAGKERGYIPNLEEALVDLGEETASRALQLDTGISINPICPVNPWGTIIWGNRTLLNNTSGLKASSFLNVRLLVTMLKKRCYITAKELLFEQNDSILWVRFKSRVSALLDNMIAGRGIKAYRFIKGEVVKGKLKCILQIIPIEAVETFDITIDLRDELSTVEEEVR